MKDIVITHATQGNLKNVSVCIPHGKLTGVIGVSGSGKSTLIQHFNGLLQPTSGKIYVDGKDIWDEKRFGSGGV